MRLLENEYYTYYTVENAQDQKYSVTTMIADIGVGLQKYIGRKEQKC